VNKLGDYPVWLFMFIGQIVLPMLGCATVAIKILVKNGKDMQRELWGVGAKPGKFEGKQKKIHMVHVQIDKGNHHGGQVADQDSAQVPVQSGLNSPANLPGQVLGFNTPKRKVYSITTAN
jgi:hypothetical protein